MRNTKQKGVLRFFIYFDPKEKEFVGLCVELGIIKCGDNPFIIEKELEEAAQGYLSVVSQKNLPDHLLNQKLPSHYKKIFSRFTSSIQHENTKTRIKVPDEARLFIKAIPELCPAT